MRDLLSRDDRVALTLGYLCWWRLSGFSNSCRTPWLPVTFWQRLKNINVKKLFSQDHSPMQYSFLSTWYFELDPPLGEGRRYGVDWRCLSRSTQAEGNIANVVVNRILQHDRPYHHQSQSVFHCRFWKIKDPLQRPWWVGRNWWPGCCLCCTTRW
jgi:hypothetical protein